MILKGKRKINPARASEIATLLILVSLVGIDTILAVKPPRQDTELLTHGTGQARWVDNMIMLEIDGNPLGNMDSWAKVKIDYSMDFDDIQSFSFKYRCIRGSRTPRMTIELDTNNDGRGDMWVVQWTGERTSGYHIHDLDDWYVYPYIYGQELVHKTLKEIQFEIDGTVVAIKVVVGNWDHIDAHKALVGCVQINSDVLVRSAQARLGNDVQNLYD